MGTPDMHNYTGVVNIWKWETTVELTYFSPFKAEIYALFILFYLTQHFPSVHSSNFKAYAKYMEIVFT